MRILGFKPFAESVNFNNISPGLSRLKKINDISNNDVSIQNTSILPLNKNSGKEFSYFKDTNIHEKRANYSIHKYKHQFEIPNRKYFYSSNMDSNSTDNPLNNYKALINNSINKLPVTNNSVEELKFKSGKKELILPKNLKLYSKTLIENNKKKYKLAKKNSKNNMSLIISGIEDRLATPERANDFTVQSYNMKVALQIKRNITINANATEINKTTDQTSDKSVYSNEMNLTTVILKDYRDFCPLTNEYIKPVIVENKLKEQRGTQSDFIYDERYHTQGTQSTQSYDNYDLKSTLLREYRNKLPVIMTTSQILSKHKVHIRNASDLEMTSNS